MLKIKRSFDCNKDNYKKCNKRDIEYIVIHYTGNNGDTAYNNAKYFSQPNRNASAHYFVDSKYVEQIVNDTDIAWHCGTKGKYKHPYCRNSNSIGVELCSHIDSKGEYYFDTDTFWNAVELVKKLMYIYHITPDRVVRHYDVTGKMCPAPMIKNLKVWDNFKKEIIK